MRKPVFPVSDQVCHTKLARGLQFRIKEEEGLHYQCSENKGADQLGSYAFVFAYMYRVLIKFEAIAALLIT